MNNHLPPKFRIILTAILSCLFLGGLAFAQEPKTDSSVEFISDLKQEQAIKYRELGLASQRMGNLAEALSFYQKAAAIYPNFAAVYNDIGVIYEGIGTPERAEENYLKSIKIDPSYVSAYANLALYYEGQRNLEQAAFYWDKRATLGDPLDPWTQKAISRLRDIRSSLSGRPLADQQEKDVLGLIQDVAEDKTEFNQNDETLAQAHFKKAQQSFDRGDMATAIKEALDAEHLDPNNREIEAFIEKAERRALTQ